MLFMVFWLMLSVLCLVSMFVSNSVLSSVLWSIVAFSWALIILTIFYILYSYIIKTPKYLETEEAIQELKEELEEKQAKKEKDQKISSSSRLQEKLRKLKDLKDNDLLTEEEYNQKKNQLLETL